MDLPFLSRESGVEEIVIDLKQLSLKYLPQINLIDLSAP